MVGFDRMRRRLLDEDGVREKFGVSPASIPDWLALVGDDADGIPGLPRWGERSASALLARYGHLEAIPDVPLEVGGAGARGRGAGRRACGRTAQEALLYRTLATLRTDVPLAEDLDALRWRGPAHGALAEVEAALGETGLGARVPGGA